MLERHDTFVFSKKWLLEKGVNQQLSAVWVPQELDELVGGAFK
jgi:hypothetical protein